MSPDDTALFQSASVTRRRPSLLKDLAKLARVTREFPRFLRTPITVGDAAETIKQRLATRALRFIALARRAIYANSRSPYLPLLRAAGCELGDLEALVAADGLEGALTKLAQAGVYLTFDEFKGRKQIIRGSLRMICNEDDFDNPGIVPHIEAWSGGTRSPGTSVKLSLSYFLDLAINTAITLEMQGMSEYDHAVWLQGFTPGFIYAKLGRPVLAWFYPVGPLSLKHKAVSRYLVLLSRLAGRPLPPPRLLDIRDPGGLANWLADRRKEGRAVCLTTYASSAVRICAAAREKGISLDGTSFITLGEPFTEAKRRTVEAVGARALVRYAFTEAGIIGYGCRSPREPDDVHFFRDSYGLIQRQRAVGDPGLTVDAFLFTSLLPSAPKILVNVESGDYGIFEQRSCGCELDALGLSTHIAQIRSFEKLSSEGMTFVQTDLLRLLEEVLPARFGGTSTDYQVLELEDEQGILRLLLI